MSPSPNILPAPAAPRLTSLDALRGIAIVAMCYSGLLYGLKALPSWMFHAQIAPPTFKFDGNLPGYTWVDLVFPAFLFSMGCAMPFALGRRLDKGAGLFPTIWGAVVRMAMLVYFALYVQNLQPYVINSSPDAHTWFLALAAFVSLYPVFGVLPKHWNNPTQYAVRVGGYVVTFALMVYAVLLRTPEATIGEVGRWIYLQGNYWTVLKQLAFKSDIIILVLANMALFAAVLWIITRRSHVHRIGAMVLAYALWRTEGFEGVWQEQWLNNKFTIASTTIDLGWFYNFNYLKYLLVVLPGTMVGDYFVQWLAGEKGATSYSSSSKTRLMICAVLSLGLVVLCMTLLYARELPFLRIGMFQISCLNATPYMAALMIGTITYLLPAKTERGGTILRQLILAGTYLLFLGLIFEPLKGGIKKDPSDVTYYFVSSGLSIYLLLFFFILGDLLRWEAPFRMLVLNGQNPLLAYFGIRNLLAPLTMLAFIPISDSKTGIVQMMSINQMVVDLINSTWEIPEQAAWGLAGWAFVKTLLLSIVIAELTKRKVIWKS